MENNNKKGNNKDKKPYSLKEQINGNPEKKTDINNLSNSILSIKESNTLIGEELSQNKNQENIKEKNLYALIEKYLFSPKNNDFNTLNNKNNRLRLSLPTIIDKRENTFETELSDNFDYYQTIVLYKEGKFNNDIKRYKKCRLVIKENFLYLLKIYNNIKSLDYINPENSFLLKIERDKNIDKKDKADIKCNYDMTKPILCLNFNLITCALLINKIYLKEFTLLILGTNKRYSFIIEENDIKEKTCYNIGNIIYNSKGYKYNKCDFVLHNKNFFTQAYITPDDLENIAKTGDLLLFKTRHILADIQRFFTCDTYDHIAFIHSNFGFITIFDASKVGACKPHYWGNFRASMNNLVFEKICYRRLNIEEKDYEKKTVIQESIENMTEEFMNKMTDKKYYVSFCNILFKGQPKDYEIKGEWEKCDGYSCSSLVAALYIKLGIIKLKNTIHSIKPGDFEQNKNICFLPGFSLGPEKIIQFSGE